MIYKFDILFKKTLSDGGVKVITYRSLLENPKAFGENETLAGAIGELSLVREGTEKGFSLNSLLRKYNSLLIGRHLAEIFRKEFPLQFIFTSADDVTSIQAQITDENGNNYAAKSGSKDIVDEEVLNFRDIDSSVMIITENREIELSDEIGTNLTLKRGEVAYVMASTSLVVIKAEKVKILRMTLDES